MDIFKFFKRQKVDDTKTCSQQVEDYINEKMEDYKRNPPKIKPEDMLCDSYKINVVIE